MSLVPITRRVYHMEQKTMTIVIAVVAVIIVAAAAIVIVNNGNKNGDSPTPAVSMVEDAKSFADDYKGVFGPFTVEDGSAADKATVMKKNESDKLPYSKITWTKASDAAGKYATLSAEIKAKQPIMGAQPIMLDVSGLQNVTAMKYDVTIGTMGTFTLFYFATYVNDVLIESVSNCLYRPGQAATDTEMSAVLTSVGKTVGINSVTVTTPGPSMSDCADKFANDYSGVIGKFTKEDGATKTSATVSKKNESDKLPYSKITWTVESDAKAKYTELSESIKAKTKMMGADPILLEVTGLDNVTALKYDVKMGTMSTFTLYYFAAYVGNILIQSVDSCIYKASSFATDAELSELMTSVGKTVGVKSVTVTTPQEDAKMTDLANAFIEDYEGVFETFVLDESSTDTVATVSKANAGSTMLPYSKITWTASADASTDYAKLAAELKAKSSVMGSDPIEMTVTGFNNVTMIKYDVNMGSSFSLVYFAAYVDEVLIQSIDDCIYKSEGFATDAELSALLTSVGKTVGIASVTVTTPSEEDKGEKAASAFSAAYADGAFGTYTATGNTATANVGSPRNITFTVSDDAEAGFNAIKAAINTDPGTFTVVTIDSFEGFDGAFAFMKSRAMGPTEVSMLYITAYKGDIVIDGASSYQYRNSGFAKESDINTMFTALLTAVTE